MHTLIFKRFIFLLLISFTIISSCKKEDPGTCIDGIQNGTETGIDCGGDICPACPTCNDNKQNGTETGVDCGGDICPACPTCKDGIQNGGETAIDCGGDICPACPTCEDGIRNGDETEVDCGGDSCPVCPTCEDGIQNGDETEVDCGGSSCTICDSELCASQTCLNGGECFVNELGIPECDCPEGYEGVNCEDKDECGDITCPDNVTADSPVSENGACLCYCTPGYEGDECDQEIRAKITGLNGKQYRVLDICETGDYQYTVDILPSSTDISNFTISNFGGFNTISANVVCEIVGINEDGNLLFVIPKYTDTYYEETITIDSFQDGDIFGQIGIFNRNTGAMSITWRVTDGVKDKCTSLFEPL